MFRLTRRNPVEDVFDFQREVDGLFNQLWNDLPTRAATASTSPSIQVNTTDDGWLIDVAMPGIDPQHVTLEVAGQTLSIRAELSADGKDRPGTRYEQTLTIPQFLDVERLSASHWHGLLRLTLPLKESVKPRRIQIATQPEPHKELTGVA